MPKARTPSTWVTVFASQPSVSIETETTQRIVAPRRPSLPTVFMTSRRRSWSLMFVAGPRIARALDDLATEALDLVAGRFPKVLVEILAGLKLFAIDEQGAGRASLLPCSSKLRKSLSRPFSRLVEPSSFLALVARDEVVDELRRRGVVADHYEARRDLMPDCLP